VLLRRSFLPTVKRLEEAGELPAGGILAVVYDKNPMEASGCEMPSAWLAELLLVMGNGRCPGRYCELLAYRLVALFDSSVGSGV
jgi:hypothetical protein